MPEGSQKLEALLKEYEQLKAEIRTALDVYEKIYGSLVAVVTVVAGLIVAASIPERGVLFALIPITILGILGVVWYGHEVALARLSARLEVVEYWINFCVGQEDLFSWQSHWATIAPQGVLRGWQRVLAVLAMMPSVAIYLGAAWLSDSWWVNLFSPPILRGIPFIVYFIVLALVFLLHEAWYMQILRSTLRAEVEKNKKIVTNANINHYPLSNTEPASR